MIKILVIEDSWTKQDNIKELVQGLNVELTFKGNWHDGIVTAVKAEHELIILDMGLPRYADGTGLEAKMGESIIKELNRKKIKTPVIVNSTTLVDVSKYNNVVEYWGNEFYGFKEKREDILNALNME